MTCNGFHKHRYGFQSYSKILPEAEWKINLLHECVLQGWSGASVAYAVGAAVSGDGYTILQPDACEVKT